MSTPNTKQLRKQKRKGADIATSVTALDGSSKAAASRASGETAQDLAVSSNWSYENQVNPKCSSEAGAATDGPSVVDDLPHILPVTAPELAVIETYLGNLIDQLLADAEALGSTAKASRSFNEGTRPSTAMVQYPS